MSIASYTVPELELAQTHVPSYYRTDVPRYPHILYSRYISHQLSEQKVSGSILILRRRKLSPVRLGPKHVSSTVLTYGVE